MVPWAHPSPQLKWHLDRSSHCGGLTSVTDRATDRPTDHTTRSVTIDHIYVRSTVMRPNKNEACTYMHGIACQNHRITYILLTTFGSFE